MNMLGRWLTKYRKFFLIILLMLVLAVSGYANRQRIAAASMTVRIPITETVEATLTPMEICRQQRDHDALRDMEALEALINQPLLDKATREDAAEQLQRIIDARQAQAAIENALSTSSLYPCTAVVTGETVTVVTGKSSVNQTDTALVLTLASAHAGAAPENVHIIGSN